MIDVLGETRERTLAIVAPLSDEDVEAVHNELMSPLAWDLAHIAAYEDLWIAHRIGGRPLLHPELAAMYDAFETPRAVRGDLPLLDRAGALEYLEQTRERTQEILGTACDTDLVELVLRHEQQHNETMLQAIELAALSQAPGMPRLPRPSRNGGPPPTGLERVEIPAGAFEIGAAPDGFAYDNERPRHEVGVAAFAIGRVPVTNLAYLEFVEGGGYNRREWWSDEGWTFKRREGIDAPLGWVRVPGGEWMQRRIDAVVPLPLEEPVVHVSWFEAEAFALAHGARLPTEAEWEKAATWDPATGATRSFPWGDEPPAAGDGRANLDHGSFGPSRADAKPGGASPSGVLGMLGDVWEWTADAFYGYPGFVAHPYREYSEVFFGEAYRVLRGGSWATRCRVASPTFRNWDLPERRQIFSGIRLAWPLRQGRT